MMIQIRALDLELGAKYFVNERVLLRIGYQYE